MALAAEMEGAGDAIVIGGIEFPWAGLGFGGFPQRSGMGGMKPSKDSEDVSLNVRGALGWIIRVP